MLAVSLLASLLAAEAMVRLVAPQQLILLRPDIWQPADTLGWTHRPLVDTHVNTGEGTVRVFTDSRGFRTGPDGPVDADTRVLLLGDSFMAALQVEHAESLAGRMEGDLPDALGRPVAVWNTGVSSWDPPHYLIQARKLIPDHDFSMVVVAVYLGNDVVDWRTDAFSPRQAMERWRFRVPRELSRAEWIEALARPIDDILKRRSHLFVLSKNAFATALMRAGLSARYIPEELQSSQAASPAWANTADLLHEIHLLASRHGIPVVVALIPSAYQVEPDMLDRHARLVGFDLAGLDPDQPSRILGGKLEARGLEVIDLLPRFRRAMEAGSPPLYGRVDPHFTAEGHAVMWEGLRPVVLEYLRGVRVPGENGEADR